MFSSVYEREIVQGGPDYPSPRLNSYQEFVTFSLFLLNYFEANHVFHFYILHCASLKDRDIFSHNLILTSDQIRDSSFYHTMPWPLMLSRTFKLFLCSKKIILNCQFQIWNLSLQNPRETPLMTSIFCDFGQLGLASRIPWNGWL